MDVERINEELTEYTDKNCPSVYAQIRTEGRLEGLIQLDYVFSIEQLEDILNIIKK